MVWPLQKGDIQLRPDPKCNLVGWLILCFYCKLPWVPSWKKNGCLFFNDITAGPEFMVVAGISNLLQQYLHFLREGLETRGQKCPGELLAAPVPIRKEKKVCQRLALRTDEAQAVPSE